MRSITFLFGLLFLVSAGILAWFVPRAFFVAGSPDAPAIAIEVKSGWTTLEVSEALKEKGLIDSAFGYRVYAWGNRSARVPRAGTYRFVPPQSYRLLARIIAAGPERDEREIKIIEGRTIQDEASVLADLGIDEALYYDLVGKPLESKPFDQTLRDDFSFLFSLPKGASLEGYLFPDTYRVWKDQLPQSLVRKQLSEFAKRADRITVDAAAQGRTLSDVVILASIVEKEVSSREDRKVVAGIFLNRLKQGMALQSDATVNYVTQSGRARSTSKDLDTESPYNTYRNKGLPPAPISNPGDDALEAALHPATTSYVYFLTDEQGKVYYAKTFEEHQRNRQRAFGQ